MYVILPAAAYAWLLSIAQAMAYKQRLPIRTLPAETFNALLLSKSLRQRMWTDSSVETRQLSGIGPQIAQVRVVLGTIPHTDCWVHLAQPAATTTTLCLHCRMLELIAAATCSCAHSAWRRRGSQSWCSWRTLSLGASKTWPSATTPLVRLWLRSALGQGDDLPCTELVHRGPRSETWLAEHGSLTSGSQPSFAGNEVHAALAKCLPPAIKLQCLPVSWLPGGLVELEITGGRKSKVAGRRYLAYLHAAKHAVLTARVC